MRLCKLKVSKRVRRVLECTVLQVLQLVYELKRITKQLARRMKVSSTAAADSSRQQQMHLLVQHSAEFRRCCCHPLQDTKWDR